MSHLQKRRARVNRLLYQASKDRQIHKVKQAALLINNIDYLIY